MQIALFLLFPAIALAWAPLWPEEFETTKMFIFLTFSSFAIFWINWKLFFKDKIAIALGLFTLSAAASTALSIDSHMAFYGNSKCPNGLLVTLSYLVLYLALTQNIKTIKLAHKLIDLLLATSALISVYAFIQMLGLDPKQWNGTLSFIGYTRPMSTLGHPNFMANYLAMLIPFGLYRMEIVKKNHQKILCALVILMAIANIGFSLSRGMYIATLGSLLVYFSLKRARLKEVASFAIVLAIIGASSLWMLPTFRVNALDRMQSFLSPGPARLEYPKAAIRIWKHYPLFGVGTDAYEIAFQRQRTTYYWNVERAGSPHRAHNDFLNILATQGLYGALSAILLTVFIALKLKASHSPFVIPATASIVCFYIAGLTSFVVVATGTLFILYISILGVDK